MPLLWTIEYELVDLPDSLEVLGSRTLVRESKHNIKCNIRSRLRLNALSRLTLLRKLIDALLNSFYPYYTLRYFVNVLCQKFVQNPCPKFVRLNRFTELILRLLVYGFSLARLLLNHFYQIEFLSNNYHFWPSHF